MLDKGQGIREKMKAKLRQVKCCEELANGHFIDAKAFRRNRGVSFDPEIMLNARDLKQLNRIDRPAILMN